MSFRDNLTYLPAYRLFSYAKFVYHGVAGLLLPMAFLGLSAYGARQVLLHRLVLKEQLLLGIQAVKTWLRLRLAAPPKPKEASKEDAPVGQQGEDSSDPRPDKVPSFFSLPAEE